MIKKTIPADHVMKYSAQSDDVGASILFAVMKMNRPDAAGISDETRMDFLEVIKHAELETYSPGTTIMKKGEIGDSLCIILEGIVYVDAPEGKQIQLQKGNMVGQMSVLTDEPRNATVTAGDTTVSMLMIKKETLFANPGVYHCLLGNGLIIKGRNCNYELVQKVGEGTTSKVYEIGGHNLCAKVYKKTLDFEGDFISRFIAENFLDLKHPYIVNVYEMIEAYGTRFIIMDWAKGAALKKQNDQSVKCLTLRHLLRLYREEGRRIDGDVAVTIFCEIADALVYTHRHGYVHRDVKPENIFIDVREGAMAFMLADFGLALPVNTKPEKIVGTPQYMPPEAVAFDNPDNKISGAADFYSLAAVCYEVLAGEKLFKGSNILELVRQHQHAEPDFKKLPANAPGKLREFIERSLNKNPEERPAPHEVEKYIKEIQHSLLLKQPIQ
ncbi:MAG: protein kinase [Pseudomonadota bacterium]